MDSSAVTPKEKHWKINGYKQINAYSVSKGGRAITILVFEEDWPKEQALRLVKKIASAMSRVRGGS